MESTLSDFDIQDMELYMMSNATDQTLATAGIQNTERYMMMDVKEPSFTTACLLDFELAMMAHAMEPTFTGTGMMWNAFDPTSASSSLQDTEPSMMLNTIEPSFAAAGVQVSGLTTKSSTRPAAGDQWASKDDWKRLKPFIKRLYVDEDRKLKEVMTIMEKEHGFKATTKMYKDRIKIWHFGKNFKEPEMAAILRKKTQRDGIGKRSLFQVRGRSVVIEDVYRYFHRKQTVLDKLSAQYGDAPTPSDLSCTTPPLSPRFEVEVPRSPSTPHSLLAPEQLVFNINRYMSVSFDNKIWTVAENGMCMNTITSTGDSGYRHNFFEYCLASADLADNGLFVEARRVLSKACTLIPSILKGEAPETISFLLDIILKLIAMNLPEIATLLTGYIGEMSRILLEAKHPWGQICRLMGIIEPDHLKATLIRSYECLIEVQVRWLGQLQITSLQSQISFIEYSYSRDLLVAEQRLRKLKSQFREATSNVDQCFYEILPALGNNLILQAKYVEAELVAFELLKITRKNRNFTFYVLGLEYAVPALFYQGKMDLAESYLLEAVELIGRHCESSSPWALQEMIHMMPWMQIFRTEEKVKELAKEIELRMVACNITDDE